MTRARNRNPLGKNGLAFSPAHWRALATMIRAIPDNAVRQLVANHAAQYFVKLPGCRFDAEQWNGATGGRLTGPVTLAGNETHDGRTINRTGTP